MPYTDEQRRKGQILKARQLAVRPRLTVEELARRVKVSKRQIEKIYAGETWNLGTVHLMMEELGMNDDDFGGAPASEYAQEAADQAIWRRFPNDVQVFLMFAGAILAKHRDEGRRKDEIDRTTLFMLERDSVRNPNG